MTECQEFFDALNTECIEAKSARIRGDRLRAQGGADRHARLLEWEKQSASAHSPGPVGDSEYLRKALFELQDIVDGTMHRNTFLPLADIGLSADRTTYATPEESQARFAAMSTRNGKQLHGYVDLHTAKLREQRTNLTEDGKPPVVQAIGVYDTASAENSSHAEAFMLLKRSGTKPLKTLQTDLVDHYKDKVERYSS